MEYYCIMVLTGEEKKFKQKALERLKQFDSHVNFYYFERRLYTRRRGWFLGSLFPGYIFFQIEKFTPDFFSALKTIHGFCRILTGNTNPTKITGAALDELRFLIQNGEELGVSKIQFLPNQLVKAVSGPLAGYEGNIVAVNKKQKRIKVRSSLTPMGATFDLKYEEVDILH